MSKMKIGIMQWCTSPALPQWTVVGQVGLRSFLVFHHTPIKNCSNILIMLRIYEYKMTLPAVQSSSQTANEIKNL